MYKAERHACALPAESEGFTVVQICVGSSCHLKGTAVIVTKINQLIEERHLENDVILNGSFCAGKCNREGVTIQVDDDMFTGVTPETFEVFFEEEIMARIGRKAGLA
jgi:NADH:ubiquinone oxidoreductase subunit E